MTPMPVPVPVPVPGMTHMTISGVCRGTPRLLVRLGIPGEMLCFWEFGLVGQLSATVEIVVG